MCYQNSLKTAKVTRKTLVFRVIETTVNEQTILDLG